MILDKKDVPKWLKDSDMYNNLFYENDEIKIEDIYFLKTPEFRSTEGLKHFLTVASYWGINLDPYINKIANYLKYPDGTTNFNKYNELVNFVSSYTNYAYDELMDKLKQKISVLREEDKEFFRNFFSEYDDTYFDLQSMIDLVEDLNNLYNNDYNHSDKNTLIILTCDFMNSSLDKIKDYSHSLFSLEKEYDDKLLELKIDYNDRTLNEVDYNIIHGLLRNRYRKYDKSEYQCASNREIENILMEYKKTRRF
jgi:hypothetical protein